MCTVVLSFEPGNPVPLLLLGVRDELMDRPWLPPARHWPGWPLVGGLDEQAGGTWLAVHPGIPRVSCLLNGRGTQADQAGRRSRGGLPLRAAAEGLGVLKELADDPKALATYDPFYLICADTEAVRLVSWDGDQATLRDLDPGTHLLTTGGYAYPAAPVTEPRALRFGPKFAASRPSGDPALPLGQAWGGWLTLAAGDGLDPADPAAIVIRHDLPDGRVAGSTSVSLVALAADGGLRYDFQPRPGAVTGWYSVNVAVLTPAVRLGSKPVGSDIRAEDPPNPPENRKHVPSTGTGSRDA